MRRVIGGMAVTALLVAAVACGDDEEEPAGQPTATGTQPAGEINPNDFSKTVDNLLFPLSSFSTLVYEGEEVDPETGEMFTTRVEMTVMPEEEKTVAGVEVLVVQDQAFEDGELIESTLDYFAQHSDGSVYYFGEDVNNYENGELKDHEGSWLAGEGENQPGVIMPPDPQVGDVFEQEKAPGIAEDRMTVLSVDEAVEVPAGSWEGCVKTEDVNPLDGTGAIEFKYYCPDIGFVLEEFEDGNLELVSHE
jgi:hypothetical protein